MALMTSTFEEINLVDSFSANGEREIGEFQVQATEKVEHVCHDR